MIEAHRLHYSYPGGIRVLNGLDLAVGAGCRMAIVGANGAGKTTLLLHLNGTLKPQQGDILIDGQPVDYSARSLTRWRSTVGLVLQDPDDQLFAGSVYQDVSFGPLNLGLTDREVRTRVQDALAAMRITGLADRPTHMLSFGQKQRVAIAGVLAMAPRVLVLDEPTAGLDPLGVNHLLAALRALVTAGTTIVYATHDVDLACAWSDVVAVCHAGRIAACGRPEVVLADREVLRAANLRLPLVLECALGMQERGLTDPRTPLPRNRSELIEWIARAANAAAAGPVGSKDGAAAAAVTARPE
jgi:cobalt/nickel transport system ATP-binding protein